VETYFVAAVNGALQGRLIPVAGGVLVRDRDGVVLGAVCITGDTSENAAAAGGRDRSRGPHRRGMRRYPAESARMASFRAGLRQGSVADISPRQRIAKGGRQREAPPAEFANNCLTESAA
jgi:hypothetical protein